MDIVESMNFHANASWKKEKKVFGGSLFAGVSQFFVFLTCLSSFSLVNTAAETVVVHRPFLSPVAVCVTLVVLIIIPLVLKSCSFSSQAISGSNCIPIVVASIAAGRSSA